MNEDAEATAAVRAMLDQWHSLSRALVGGGAEPAGQPVAETVGRLLALVNLPSRDDVLAVADAIAALDARLARIEQRLEPTAATARSGGFATRSTTMADLSHVKEHMNIIGADGVHVGTVDHVDGDRIKLTKDSTLHHHHHWISGGLVAEVEGDNVRLSANADVAVTFEEEK